MIYTEKDFESCLFNPLTKKAMLKAYPRLSEISPAEADTLPFFDNVLRYVCLLYDPKSPLITAEMDLNYRKSVAAELAGFDTDGDDAFLQTIYNSELEWPVSLTTRFLIRFIKQRKWAYIVALEFKFWEGIQRIMKPVEKTVGGKDWDELKSIEIKAKISDEASKDIARLDTLYKEFFNEDEALENAAKNLRVTPEMIASANV
jgi:hypothetical protein